MSINKDLGKILTKVRQKNPLVHNITNYVVMNSTANILLALGASPVMAHAVEEVEEMVKIAQALVINVGTLSSTWVEAMCLAMLAAKDKQIPIVFDPVGCGATNYRTQTCQEIVKKFSPNIIRGNASEILALAGAGGTTKGVDSAASSDVAHDAAQRLSALTGGVVCVSGKVDFIVDQQHEAQVYNGHAWMSKVTGMGCAATTVIAAFAAVHTDPFIATVAAMSLLGVVGERAQLGSAGPGTFQAQFLDEIFSLSSDDFNHAAKVEFKYGSESVSCC